MGVPGNADLLLLKTAAAAGGYQVSRSLRFSSGDSSYLSRTPASAGNRRTWTFSAWVKRSSLGVFQSIFNCIASDASYYTQFIFETSDKFVLYDNLCPGGVAFTTTQVFRDTSAWFHFLLYYDTTQSTASAKAKLYINGIEVTQFDADNRSSLTADSSINRTAQHVISGRLPYTGGSSGYLSGYLAEIHFIDGQALTPSSFTETDATTGQLIPKLYSGSYGTNGFKLNFSDNSAATAAALGKDTSGNGNNWTPNNLSVTAGAGNDSLVDTPTSYGTGNSGGDVRGNFATLNPLKNGASNTLSNGNLTVINSVSSTNFSFSTIALPKSGKWYFEGLASANGGDTFVQIGVFSTDHALTPTGSKRYWYLESGLLNEDGSTLQSVSTYGNGDLIGVAYNADANTVTWYKNNVQQGTAVSVSTSYEYYFGVGIYKGQWDVNFGQRAFAYTAPSGFKALCDTNLPAPVVAKSSTVMDIALYSGNSSTQSISGYNLSPDFVWIKTRGSVANNHFLFDAVRGATKYLCSDLTIAEATVSNTLTSFDSGGFTTGSNNDTNASGRTFVAWMWDAGTSTVTNTQGSITSSVRANASAGFSIVSYNSGSSTGNVTLGHGLNVAPKFIIHKSRSTSNWWVYHASVIDDLKKYMQLNSTNAIATNSNNMWGGAFPTSSVFGVTVGDLIGTSQDAIAYVFSPVAGYSSFGSYTGNGSSDGPFVYTGFRPKWLLVKETTNSNNWFLLDATRSPYNYVGDTLWPNLSNQENDTSINPNTTYNNFDFVSNGFKPRSVYSGTNRSGGTYIYCAFAESPFQYARAR